MTMARLALVLENDPELRRRSLSTLSTAGYQVESVSSGDDGIRLVESERPEIVVVNLRLDAVSGLDFLTLLPYVGDRAGMYIIAIDDSGVLPQDTLGHYGVNEVVRADDLEVRLNALIHRTDA